MSTHPAPVALPARVRCRGGLRPPFGGCRSVGTDSRGAAVSVNETATASPEACDAIARQRPSFPESRDGSPSRPDFRGQRTPSSWDWAAPRAGSHGGDSAPPSTSIRPGGTTFALLAPCSLRPSGHLRWASSSHPNSSVVSSVPRGAAASILRNQIPDLRYQSSVLDREAASQSSAAELPLPSLLAFFNQRPTFYKSLL
jgi:hypothetical protein